MVTAYYRTRKGAGGVRQIKTAAEAEKILKGGYSATTVRLEDEDGMIVGERWKLDKWNGGRWTWFYDADYFK